MNDAIVLALDEGATASDVAACLRGLGLRVVERSPVGHLMLHGLRWRAGDGAEVWYVEDHVGDARSLRVSTEHGGPRAAELAKALGAALPVVELETLADRIAQGDPIACIRSAGRIVSLCGPDPDARVLESLARLLTHRDDAVRRAGIRLGWACRWPQARAIVAARLPHETRLRPTMEALAEWLPSDHDVSGG
jgi:hypothetical protein